MPAGTQAPAQAPQSQPFAVFPDAKSFEARVKREARKMLNEAARAAGYDDWEHMQSEIGQRQPAPTSSGTNVPASSQAAATSAEAERLQMALQVGARLNLPVALVARLQGRTPEEMEADAQQLLALIRPQGQQAPAVQSPGIPSVPQTNQPTVFTRAQLQDPKFVREHADEIRKAAREGRIVNS